MPHINLLKQRRYQRKYVKRRLKEDPLFRKKLNETSRKWQKNNLEKYKKYQKELTKRHKKDPTKYRYWRKVTNSKSQNARRRGIDFNLTTKDIKNIYSSKKCHYCGAIETRMSIDRKNNNKPYMLDNVVLCCYRCNSMKNKIFSYEEMLILGKAFRKISRVRNSSALN